MSETHTEPGPQARAAVAETLIRARSVTRILPGIVPMTLVHDIDLTIGAKEFVGITGPSGSGKSSLLYLLGLLDLPTSGRGAASAVAPRRTWTRPSAPRSASPCSASCSSSTSCCRSSRRSTTSRCP